MAKSRLRPKRATYQQPSAKHFGWSKGKTFAIIVMLLILSGFMLLVFIALFLLR